MRRIVRSSLTLLCLWALCLSALGAPERQRTGGTVAASKIENRDQLLAAINAWLKEHHEPEWTTEELIGRVVDEAYESTHLWKALETPVESFVVCLIKNKRFHRGILLQGEHRDKIELHTAEGEITRVRAEWRSIVQRQQKYEFVHSKSSRTPRPLALPSHDILSIEVLATSAEIRDKKENPDGQTRWGIFLFSTLTGKKSAARSTKKNHANSPFLVATPQQLLGAVNSWRRQYHRPELTLDEITIRVADEVLAITDPSEKTELFLECLAKNKPFVYPMRMGLYGGDEIEVTSTKERLHLPPHDAISIEVLTLPWDKTTEEHHFVINWVTYILSYYFPTTKELAKSRHAQ